jgi:hypothetical protein
MGARSRKNLSLRMAINFKLKVKDFSEKMLCFKPHLETVWGRAL